MGNWTAAQYEAIDEMIQFVKSWRAETKAMFQSWREENLIERQKRKDEFSRREMDANEVPNTVSASDLRDLSVVTIKSSSVLPPTYIVLEDDSNLDSRTEVFPHQITTDSTLDSSSDELIEEPILLATSFLAPSLFVEKDHTVFQVSISQLEPSLPIHSVSVGVGSDDRKRGISSVPYETAHHELHVVVQQKHQAILQDSLFENNNELKMDNTREEHFEMHKAERNKKRVRKDAYGVDKMEEKQFAIVDNMQKDLMLLSIIRKLSELQVSVTLKELLVTGFEVPSFSLCRANYFAVWHCWKSKKLRAVIDGLKVMSQQQEKSGQSGTGNTSESTRFEVHKRVWEPGGVLIEHGCWQWTDVVWQNKYAVGEVTTADFFSNIQTLASQREVLLHEAPTGFVHALQILRLIMMHDVAKLVNVFDVILASHVHANHSFASTLLFKFTHSEVKDLVFDVWHCWKKKNPYETPLMLVHHLQLHPSTETFWLWLQQDIVNLSHRFLLVPSELVVNPKYSELFQYLGSVLKWYFLTQQVFMRFFSWGINSSVVFELLSRCVSRVWDPGGTLDDASKGAVGNTLFEHFLSTMWAWLFRKGGFDIGKRIRK